MDSNAEKVMKKNTKPKNILIIRLSALGDVAMTIPAIYSVAMTYAGHHFYVLTNNLCAQLFIRKPSNITLIPAEDISTGKILKSLHKIRIDKVADLHNVSRSWMIDLYFLLRLKPVAMLDKRRWERGDILFRQKHTRRPFIWRYFDVFANMGLPTQPLFTTFFGNSLPAVPLPLHKRRGIRWVGIAPFARYPSKIYPESLMLKVIKLLQGSGWNEIFLFGSKGKEEETLSQWATGLPRVHVVAGKLSLKAEIELMSHLHVMVAMDSANMHIAALTGVRVVTLWGGTTPACGFTPWQYNMNDALMKPQPCQPCSIAGSEQCKIHSFACMRELSPLTILTKILE